MRFEIPIYCRYSDRILRVKLKLIHDRENWRRTKRLGDFGEQLAIKLLTGAGFTAILNLNKKQPNYPFADLYGERGGERFVISVKTRFKYERLGGLNPRYNLGHDWRRKAHLAERDEDAIAAWLTIPADKDTYSAYFGLVALVEESNGIPMVPEALDYYECLAVNKPHGLDWEQYSPKYKIAVEGYLGGYRAR